jgi:hypothetical protein
MRSYRNWRLLGVLLALALGVSCTTADTAPTEPSFLTTDVTTQIVKSVALLSCEPQKYAINKVAVGPKGGRIKVGSHLLQIPAGALSTTVTITAEQITGTVNSVRFSPEGLKFAQPAELSMSYDNCVMVTPAKSIVYTSEQLGILKLLPSLDRVQSNTVVSPIDHFSRYAVAY